MQALSYSNPCIRCGTERIVSKIWKEKMGDSVIIDTQTICPKPECQKEVDLDNKRQENKLIAMRLKSEQRAQQRKVDKDVERLQKEKNKRKRMD